MAAVNFLGNVSVWIVMGLIAGLAFGSVGSITADLLVVVLMLQMIASMEGLKFNKSSIEENGKRVVVSLLVNYILCSGTLILSGLLFINDYPDAWKGWVMIAAVPCAVSVITMSLFMFGNMVATVLSTAFIYIASLLVTPLITFLLLGDAVDPLRLVKYLVLFIAVPMLMTFPLNRVKINRTAKVFFIDFMMFMLVFLSVGHNRDYILGEPTLVLMTVVVCAVRIFGISVILLWLMKKRNCSRDNSILYSSMSIWKNTGLAITLCLVLMTDASGAVIPCVVTLMMDNVWFIFMLSYVKRVWPHERKDNELSGTAS